MKWNLPCPECGNNPAHASTTAPTAEEKFDFATLLPQAKEALGSLYQPLRDTQTNDVPVRMARFAADKCKAAELAAYQRGCANVKSFDDSVLRDAERLEALAYRYADKIAELEREVERLTRENDFRKLVITQIRTAKGAEFARGKAEERENCASLPCPSDEWRCEPHREDGVEVDENAASEQAWSDFAAAIRAIGEGE